MNWYYTSFDTPLFNILPDYEHAVCRSISPLVPTSVTFIGQSGLACHKTVLAEPAHILSEAIEQWLGEAKAKTPVSSRKQRL